MITAVWGKKEEKEIKAGNMWRGTFSYYFDKFLEKTEYKEKLWTPKSICEILKERCNDHNQSYPIWSAFRSEEYPSLVGIPYLTLKKDNYKFKVDPIEIENAKSKMEDYKKCLIGTKKFDKTDIFNIMFDYYEKIKIVSFLGETKELSKSFVELKINKGNENSIETSKTETSIKIEDILGFKEMGYRNICAFIQAKSGSGKLLSFFICFF